jgi:hypothetical protein
MGSCADHVSTDSRCNDSRGGSVESMCLGPGRYVFACWANTASPVRGPAPNGCAPMCPGAAKALVAGVLSRRRRVSCVNVVGECTPVGDSAHPSGGNTVGFATMVTGCRNRNPAVPLAELLGRGVTRPDKEFCPWTSSSVPAGRPCLGSFPWAAAAAVRSVTSGADWPGPPCVWPDLRQASGADVCRWKGGRRSARPNQGPEGHTPAPFPQAESRWAARSTAAVDGSTSRRRPNGTRGDRRQAETRYPNGSRPLSPSVGQLPPCRDGMYCLPVVFSLLWHPHDCETTGRGSVRGCTVRRVEQARGLPVPLVEPYVQISRIRLPDRLLA